MKIEILYPDLCDLYGEPANIKYILPTIRYATVYETHIFEEPKFVSEDVDFIYIGSMSEESQKKVCEKLMPYRKRLKALIDKGIVLLATGNSLEIFGDKIIYEDGSSTDCLGFFHGKAYPKMMNRHNSLYLGKFEDNIEVVGFKSQFGHTFPSTENDSWEPLFSTVRGVGIDGKREDPQMGEGVRINNFMATYLLGPLLILNPLFTKHLLALLGEEGELQFEDVAMEVYETRLKEFKEPDRGFFY